MLLGRLRVLKAVLSSAVVDLAETRRKEIPESQRRLLDSPVPMADVVSVEDLVTELTARQTSIGQAPGARGGNPRRRIRLRLELPGFGRTRPVGWLLFWLGRLTGRCRYSCSPGIQTTGNGHPASLARPCRSPRAAEPGPSPGAPDAVQTG